MASYMERKRWEADIAAFAYHQPEKFGELFPAPRRPVTPPSERWWG